MLNRFVHSSVPILLIVAGLGPGRLAAGTSTVAGGKQLSGLVWNQQLSGSVSGRSGTMTGSARIHEASSTEPGFALTLKTIGSLALDASYTPISLDTSIDASGGLSFGGTTFDITSDGSLRYRMPIYEGSLRWIALDNDWFRLCASLGLKVADADVTLSTATASRRFEAVVPVPMAGVSGQVNLASWLKVYGSYRFLDLEVSSVKSAVDDYRSGEQRKRHDLRRSRSFA